ncbi:hypothetical protein M9Y10_000489 [Tritrichomonas musculus]|uniref:DUF3447 domain-containing protein n=1 Tax=Tritrichomonas musculus TaxID=1915356 RepID=A0ABR2L4E4_9EUKA
MEDLFYDTEKIDQFIQIQSNLLDLAPNSSEEELDNLIKRIPPNYLNQKYDLMTICQLFIYYSRNNIHNIKGNTIKLLEKIMKQIKLYLSDESTFFWNISSGLFYLKLWFYEENLISIEEIIGYCRIKNHFAAREYFFPEIIEKEPETFESDFKPILQTTFSEQYINNFKELRKKYFNWLRNSCDYHDPSYLEIEKNQLRLAIKTDDIDSFQRILSGSNISIDSTICESLIENHIRDSKEVSLIEYAIEFNSIKIVKYLVMNDVKLTDRTIFNAIVKRNNDVIHIIESRKRTDFFKESFFCSISTWNHDVLEYTLENGKLNIFENEQNNGDLNIIIRNTFSSFNFHFFKEYLLPFFRKDQSFVKDSLYAIILNTFFDFSCFFLNPFLKLPGIDINFCSFSPEDKQPLLVKAVKMQNARAIEIILSNPSIDINSKGGANFNAFQFACAGQINMKIIKMLCNHTKFEIDWSEKTYKLTGFQFSMIKGHSYATEYLINRYPHLVDDKCFQIFEYCIINHSIKSMKIVLKHYLEKNKDITRDNVLDKFEYYASYIQGYKDDDFDTFTKVLDELQK